MAPASCIARHGEAPSCIPLSSTCESSDATAVAIARSRSAICPYVEPDVHQSGKLLVSRIRGQSDVWRFPIGGSAAENTRDAVRITRQTGQAQTPSISPDGTEVVYLSDNGGHGNLWIARTDGSSVRQVTFERDPDVVLGVPMWSPSGDWIVFIVAPSGVSSLWAIRPDGSGLHEVIARGLGRLLVRRRPVGVLHVRTGRHRVYRRKFLPRAARPSWSGRTPPAGP